MSSAPSFCAPDCMLADDYSAANSARQRLAPKSGFRLLTSSLTNLRRKGTNSSAGKTDSSGEDASTSDQIRQSDTTEIDLDSSAISDFRVDKDVYRWATIYENQRGFTMFSTPYYSALSLLPRDPLPFTVPSSSSKRSKQPEVSLTEYPLPDGTWRWVSKCWMIDMRSDSGEVQHDGFEYNWRFRPEKWTANVGKLSGRGLVRRRRWVRLMMRPATVAANELGTPDLSRSAVRNSTYSSISGFPSITNDDADLDPEQVWQGDVEQDWIRCHTLMKRLGRDGRKLEQWKKWLGGYYSEHTHLGHLLKDGEQQKRQWTEDEPVPSEAALAIQPPNLTKSPALEHFADVLRLHGDSILGSFIYPDSRAQFLELLGHAGLLPQMNVGLGIGWSTTDIDFWSYVSGLDKTAEKDDAAFEAREKETKEPKVTALLDKHVEAKDHEEVSSSVEVEAYEDVPSNVGAEAHEEKVPSSVEVEAHEVSSNADEEDSSVTDHDLDSVD